MKSINNTARVKRNKMMRRKFKPMTQLSRRMVIIYRKQCYMGQHLNINMKEQINRILGVLEIQCLIIKVQQIDVKKISQIIVN